MKNVSLTFSQKLEICQEASRLTLDNVSFTQQDIAEWAAQRFKLHKKPNQTTISRILKTPAKFRTIRIRPQKRSSSRKMGDIERALFNWVIAQYHARRAVNGNLIQTVAARMVRRANENVPPENWIDINFSAGWLTCFQTCWGLRCYKSHGESGDVDLELLEEQMPKIQEVLRGYNKRDIFNADESGLYYKMAPNKTIARSQLLGRKKAKARITFMPCCNAEETEKFGLKILGNAKKPRCFRGKSGKQLGFDYDANKKAWMTSAIFFQWLKDFDDYIGKTPGKKVALLLDNCSAHGTDETQPTLCNVEVIFLPPNTTSKVQPLDAGIIAAMKMRYRRKQYDLALDLLDEGADNIYNIDQLTAMKMLHDV